MEEMQSNLVPTTEKSGIVGEMGKKDATNLIPLIKNAENPKSPEINKKQIKKGEAVSKKNHLPLFLKITFPLLALVLINLVYQNFSEILERQNLYRLKTVKFKGLHLADAEQITDALDLKNKSNLLFLDKGEIREQVWGMHRFSDVAVEVNYPDTLIIEVKEKTPKFLLRMGEQLATVTDDLDLVALDEQIKDYNLFVIELPRVNSFVHIRESKLLARFVELYRELPTGERDVTDIFSGVKISAINDEVVTSQLYLEQAKNGLEISLNLDLDSLRRARYAYLYMKKHNLKIKLIDIKRNWVVMKKWSPKNGNNQGTQIIKVTGKGVKRI